MAAPLHANDSQANLAQLNAILVYLVKHESILKLCSKILANIVRDPSNEKFHSLNDAKLAEKCNPDTMEYVYLSQFLKLIGFHRTMIQTEQSVLDKTSECRWVFQPQVRISVLNQYLNAMQSQIHSVKKQAMEKQLAVAYPPKYGDLATADVQKWALWQKSLDNFHSGSSWGNYYCVLIFVNLLPYKISIHWINKAGIERPNGSVVDIGKSVTIFAQLNHPHVVKKLGNAMFGVKDEYICGYNPTIRGVSNNGYHVIFVGGKLSPNQIQQQAMQIIAKASPDKREKPKMGPAPSPPRPEDRRGLFWGGR